MRREINTVIGICIICILGMAMYYKHMCDTIPKPIEGFVSGQCPTTLVKKGNQILLYTPEKAKVPGVNPIVFSCLKEYEKYVKWQRASGLNCPILHLEHLFDTQGNSKYEIKDSFMLDAPIGPLNHDLPALHKPPCLQKLLNANEENKPYNQNMYPSFDPYNQGIGKVTEVDMKHGSLTS